MTHDPESIADAEQIFLGRKLREARQVEELLTDADIDYSVEVEAYARSLLFGTIRYGAAFYVTSAAAAECRHRLREARLARGVVDMASTRDSPNRDRSQPRFARIATTVLSPVVTLTYAAPTDSSRDWWCAGTTATPRRSVRLRDSARTEAAGAERPDDSYGPSRVPASARSAGIVDESDASRAVSNLESVAGRATATRR
jgi:hypothetical protein